MLLALKWSKQNIDKQITDTENQVVFQDLASDFKTLTRSTLSSKETIKWEDGNEYPLIKVDISSGSHPFYTGKQNTNSNARHQKDIHNYIGK